MICSLASCSPQFVTPQSSAISSPHISERLFFSYDNTELPLNAWLPAGEIRGVIIALHGFNDYSNFIKDSVPFFNNHKLAVYSYDQRGFGETLTRGRWSGSQALLYDLTTFIELVKEKHGDTPLYILGDSMGGAVTIITMAQEYPPKVSGVILVAPAVWARSEMPFYQRFFLWLSAHTISWMTVSGKALEITPSDNIEMLKELGKDPLVIKETRIEALYGLSNLMDAAYNSAEHLRINSLLLYGNNDEIIPKKPVFEFYKRLPASGKKQQQMIVYENGYHMLLRDLQAEVVIEDIVDWIKEQPKPVFSSCLNNFR
ncbi:MAG: alpha/beta hydrolase [Desulfobacterales bacterium]|nr:lysophospholipase [Deltaproteobacteria bacterium]NNK93129.1 alpha/beta hydrolase [Desulfobacterales bacterium]